MIHSVGSLVERLTFQLTGCDLSLQLTDEWVVLSVETHVEHFVTLSHKSLPITARRVFIRVGLLICDRFLDALHLWFLGRRELSSEIVKIYVLVFRDDPCHLLGGCFCGLWLGGELTLKLR